jgi:hypothetical protein
MGLRVFVDADLAVINPAVLLIRADGVAPEVL